MDESDQPTLKTIWSNIAPGAELQAFTELHLGFSNRSYRLRGQCAEGTPIDVVVKQYLDWQDDFRQSPSFQASLEYQVLTFLIRNNIPVPKPVFVDGLSSFEQAIEAVFPKTQVQRCIIHQIRYSLKYVSWKHRKLFMRDLKKVYQASTLEEAEIQLLHLNEVWGDTYASDIRSWENNCATLTTFFDYPDQIRRLIYTTNTIEGYHRQLRKVTKTTSVFPSAKSVRKLLFLANQRITNKWTMPIPNWALILNQLAIRFQDRIPSNI